MNEQSIPPKDLKTEAAKVLLQAGWLYQDVVKVLGYESTIEINESPSPDPDKTVYRVLRELHWGLQRAT